MLRVGSGPGENKMKGPSEAARRDVCFERQSVVLAQQRMVFFFSFVTGAKRR